MRPQQHLQQNEIEHYKLTEIQQNEIEHYKLTENVRPKPGEKISLTNISCIYSYIIFMPFYYYYYIY